MRFISGWVTPDRWMRSSAWSSHPLCWLSVSEWKLPSWQPRRPPALQVHAALLSEGIRLPLRVWLNGFVGFRLPRSPSLPGSEGGRGSCGPLTSVVVRVLTLPVCPQGHGQDRFPGVLRPHWNVKPNRQKPRTENVGYGNRYPCCWMEERKEGCGLFSSSQLHNVPVGTKQRRKHRGEKLPPHLRC